MSNHPFNQLSDAEAERLAILAEECAEVIQVIGKILRHGYESRHPDDLCNTSNRILLERELGDVNAATLFMDEKGDVNRATIAAYKRAKTKRLNAGKYLHKQ